MYNIELQLETTKYDLIEYRERLICNKPPSIYDSLQIPISSVIHTVSNRSLRRQLFSRYEKLIQQTKTDLMAISIIAQQTTIYQYQREFNRQLEQMFQNDQKHVTNKEMSKLLKQLIHQRSLNMHQQLKLMHEFTMNYSVRNSYDQLKVINAEGEDSKKRIQRIGFLPSLLIDPTVGSLSSYLTTQQLQLLKRGPTYVAPCQIHVSSQFPTHTEMILQEYAPLKRQLAIIFDRFHVDINRSSNFQRDAYESFTKHFSIPIPTTIYQRALYEQQLIQSIQSLFKKNNLCLRRTADQNNLFYLDTIHHFTHLSNQYMEENTDHYHILINASEINEEDAQEQLNKIYQSINSDLEILYKENRFNKQTYNRLRVKMNRVKLPYLYFLPDISMVRNASLFQLSILII